MRHELKIAPTYFEAVCNGGKNFEIRNNHDRGFQRGDIVVLNEWVAPNGYTGNCAERRITYVTNYEQKEGFVVFGMEED